MESFITFMLTLTLSLTGCNIESATNQLQTDNVEEDSLVQSTPQPTEIETDETELNIKGDITDGFDPSSGDYVCGEENCPGHPAVSPLLSSWHPVCDPWVDKEEIEPYYCSDIDCQGHEYGDEECIKSFTIDLSFVGDCMLATSKGQYYEGSFSWYAKNEEPSYFFEKVYDIFSSDDFTIANLENVLTDNNLSEVGKNHSPAYWYKAPTENTEIIKAGSIEIVSLANNHYGDYGTQGKTDTVAALESAEIPYGTNDNTVYFEKDGFKVALICHGLWGEWQANEIITRINDASAQSDYQIVYYHGGTERIHAQEQWKIRASHKLVDAGADLVIGNHPHVLQPTEVYNGVNIVYSLGNFCFGGSSRPENRTIIYKMVLTIEEDKVINEAIDMIPCYVYTGSINNWQPAPITDESEKQKVLDFMYGKESLPY